MGAYKKWSLLTVMMLFWVSVYAYQPILTTYLNYIGASNKEIGLIVGSYGFMQMILRIPVGILSDKMKKRKLFIILGTLFTFLSALGFLLSDQIHYILLFRAMAGVAASIWVDFTILYTSYYRKQETTQAIGSINFFTFISQVFAMLVCGFLVQAFSFYASFLLSMITGLLGLVGSFFIVETKEEIKDQISIRLLVKIIDRNLIVVSLFAIISQLLTFGSIYSFIPIYAVELNANRFEISLLTVVYSLPTSFSSLYVGKVLSKKYGDHVIVSFGFILSGITIGLTPFVNSLLLLYLLQVINGVGRGFSFSVLMSLSIKTVETDKRATAMGFYQAIYGFGTFSGPVLIGLVSDIFSLQIGFLLLGILGCITAVVFMIFYRQKPIC